MEMTARQREEKVVARKVWKIVRIVLMMVRKGMEKSKVGVELNLLLKRGTKAIANSILQRHRNDGVYPGDYEFSCSNTPLHFHLIKRSKNSYHDVSTVHKAMLEILTNTIEASPLPIRRKLPITDSPFPFKDKDQDQDQVDVAAEEFIKRFYKDLHLQRTSPYHWDI
ncbi:hypothetical protein VNO78_32272 [Psophocarpus tetragonolobus]|uniref:Uncharacterized protein n=1 Tax=Psophocarpus tetragonolobus TaxID=3891 RepID=A0AAN9RP19_PSOTE